MASQQCGNYLKSLLFAVLCSWIILFILYYANVFKPSPLVDMNHFFVFSPTTIQGDERTNLSIHRQYHHLHPHTNVDNNTKDHNNAHITNPHHPSLNLRELLQDRYNTFPFNWGQDNVTQGDRYFIYRCDEKKMAFCGGWADRIKGIITGYLIANLTGRTFKAEMKTHGCNILDYIVPNHVNWSLPLSIHEQIVQGKDVHVFNAVDSTHFYNDISGINFNDFPPIQSKFVYFKSNLDFIDGFKASKHHRHQLSWMANLTRDQINGAIFRRLIKLSPPLRDQLDAFLEKNLLDPEEKLICAHIRMGRNPSIPKDSLVITNPEAVPKVWDFIQRISSKDQYKNNKVFVMTDSQQNVDEARRQTFGKKLLSVPGRILHIERNNGVKDVEVCKSQEKVVLEQFLLMSCDVLMISNSGLSRMAAYVRGSDLGLYCLVGNSVVPCTMASFNSLYKTTG